MTLIVRMGCRQPKNWFKRTASKVGGLVSFQTNLWEMLKQSMRMAKKKCNSSGKGKWVETKKLENESLHYNIEWLEITVQGTKEFEEEEYKEALELYKPFGKLFSKKEFPKDKNLSRHFKTKVLSMAKIEEAYKEGYGALSDNNLSNKLLEMGILTHVEWIQDFENRNDEIKPDF